MRSVPDSDPLAYTILRPSCEYAGVMFSPPPLIVPRNTGSLSSRAFGTWRHFPPQGNADQAASDADGMGNLVDLENEGYRSATYNSLMITKVPRKVNSLIGLWTDAEDGPVGDPILLGKGPTAAPIDAEVRKLRLAHHDGKRWHNNSGSVLVTLTWTVANERYKLFRRPRGPR